MILIVKLTDNLPHSNDSTAISDHQKLIAYLVHLGLGYAKAAYLITVIF